MHHQRRPPDARCPGLAYRSGWRRRSSPITGPSSLPVPSTPPLCACALDPYPVAHDSAVCESPLPSARQVPAFHARARITFSPPPCRTPHAQSTGTPPTLAGGPTPPPVSTSSENVSRRQQRSLCIRLHDPHLIGSRPAFSQLPNHRASCAQQQWVVWSFRLHDGLGPPSFTQHVCGRAFTPLCAFVAHEQDTMDLPVDSRRSRPGGPEVLAHCR